MNKSYLFAAMFKDSKIAQNFKLGKTKYSYVVCHGVALYFWESLLEQIWRAFFIVTMFDESCNSPVKKVEMNLQVRLWNKEKSQFDTCYYTSDFLGKFSVVDVYE